MFKKLRINLLTMRIERMVARMTKLRSTTDETDLWLYQGILSELEWKCADLDRERKRLEIEND